MTKQKDLKRVVRTRMHKTGESYTAARVHVLGKRDVGKRSAAAKKAAAPTKEPTPDYGALAGMSDETIKAKTGCSWVRWVGHLDHFGAAEMPHREIVAHVHEKFGIPGWWAQAVTVGYERIRGLRAIGQRRGGSFEANKSKTVPVPVDRLFAAWADARTRRRWLPDVKLEVRRATANRSMRITWDDGTSVVAGFDSRGPQKSIVALTHQKLPDRARADELKRYWGERLEALAEMLGAKGG
jgi:uncharacterized protein YndB with AHSA1/START domain